MFFSSDLHSVIVNTKLSKKMKKNKNAWVTPKASDAKKLRQCRKNRAPQEDDGSSSDSE